MRVLLTQYRVLLLVAATAVAVSAVYGLLAGLALLGVVFAVHEHHLRLRMQASFKNVRRLLAAESQRNDSIESYLDGILRAARGDVDPEPHERILH